MPLALFMFLALQNSVAPGVVSGRVLSTDGVAAAQAHVMAFTKSKGSIAIVSEADSGEDGRYRLEQVPPGKYYLLVGRPPFWSQLDLTNARAIAVSAGSSIDGMDLSTGESSTDPQFAILTISGPDAVPAPVHLATERGEPLPLTASGMPVRVVAKPLTWIGGVAKTQKRIMVGGVTGARYGPFSTNVPLLPAPAAVDMPASGDVILKVSDGAEYQLSIENLPQNYQVKSIVYGAIDLRRWTLQVMKGFRPSRIDIIVRLKEPGPRTGATVRGSILDALTGKPWTARAVTLSGSPGTLFADGSFEFLNVAPGAYLLQAQEGPPGDRTAETNIVVADKDVTMEVSYTSRPTYVRLAGHVLVDSAAPVPQGIRILLHSTGITPLAVGADGTFKTSLTEGAYRVSADIPAGWRIKSISSGEMDLQSLPLRIQPENGPVAADVFVTLTLANK